MTNTDLAYLSIAEASARIEAGTLTPAALVEATFARIEQVDPQVRAYVRLMHGAAMAEAHAATQRAAEGRRIGPLDGIPMGVKDIFDTANVVTSGGTGAYRDRVPVQDATAVRLLREAGAVIVGKTNTHELALGGTTNNVHYGATHNPWKLAHVPGGSSGGSGAAVAAGEALGALGSDTGGSIRIPAAFCSITGFKPTYGLVGRGGVMPLSLTLDHVGPMARSAHDCALMLNALAGYDPTDHDSIPRPAEDFTAGLEEGVRGLRLAVMPSLVEGCTPETQAAFERALATLAGLGAHLSTIEPMAGFGDWRSVMDPIIVAEGATISERILRDRPTTVGEPVRTRILAGLDANVHDYIRALEFRKDVEARFDRALGEGGVADAILLPTTPHVAEPIGDSPWDEASPQFKFRNTRVFDNTHQPSISVPCGFNADGMPIGLMISTAKWRDALALRIGHAFQQATDFHTQRPPL
ncbi:MAG: amidase [Chloroflexi bacterium]|nr:amidase [Chloroflexota bacterium]MQC18832.1 amidase [Chloroflexota bacterium]